MLIISASTKGSSTPTTFIAVIQWQSWSSFPCSLLLHVVSTTTVCPSTCCCYYTWWWAQLLCAPLLTTITWWWLLSLTSHLTSPYVLEPTPIFYGEPLLIIAMSVVSLTHCPAPCYWNPAPFLFAPLYPLCIREAMMEVSDFALCVFHVLLSDQGVFLS